MENKTTSELLDLIYKIEQVEEKDKDYQKLWDMYDDVLAELRQREPFKKILGESAYPNDYLTLEEKVDELVEDVKRLKRHKHDERSGDVMVRI